MSYALEVALVKLDPIDPRNHGKPLWVVYGARCAPQLMCVRLLAYSAHYQLLPIGTRGPNVCAWGFSIYHGEPGFRTLGENVLQWAKRWSMKPTYYAEQKDALERLRTLTTPR